MSRCEPCASRRSDASQVDCDGGFLPAIPWSWTSSVQHGIEKGRNSASRKQVRNDYGQYARFILFQQHEASTSGQKMGVAKLLRHFSTRASLPSHPELHTIVSRRDLGTSVPTLLASCMVSLGIEDPDSCDGVSRAHFHHAATACRNSGYTARKNLPSC